jgi:DMSO/TMAO reductase YedYZ heme-binding membrane subunit
MSSSGSRGSKPVRSRADTFQLSALAFAVLASLVLLVLPVYSSSTTSSETGGVEVRNTSTLLETQGTGVLGILLVPIVLTLLPYLIRSPSRGRARLTIACTVLLGIGTLLALASIGFFYLPALVCSVAASTAALRDPNRLDRISP